MIIYLYFLHRLRYLPRFEKNRKYARFGGPPTVDVNGAYTPHCKDMDVRKGKKLKFFNKNFTVHLVLSFCRRRSLCVTSPV